MIHLLFPFFVQQTPIKVEFREAGGKWVLRRAGKPYFVKGVGGTERLDELKAIGGNSVRTWGSEKAKVELIEAQKRGLTMTLGIWLGHKSYFDYANPKQVKEQYEKVRADILAHRNAPALLIWGLGNEMEAGNNTPDVWKAVGDLAKLVKSLDPNHPAMTVVAEVSQEKIDFIKKYAPEIDVLGINSYGGLASLPKRLKEFGWTKPYIVTEFGVSGPWERGKAPWGAAFEQTSSEKAKMFARDYTNSISKQDGWCVGSYSFLWGWKQEETPTWFGLFLPTGEKTERLDLLQEFWTGKKSASPSPKISSWKCPVQGKTLAPGESFTVVAEAAGRDLKFEWVIQTETPERKRDGQGELSPRQIESIVTLLPTHTFKAPKEKGKYRVALTIRNSEIGAATANSPFRVE